MNDLNIISELLDAPIAFNPSFARIVGNNLAAGILLSQLFYWAKVMNFNEFYKINEELQQECFLGRSEFENARKKILKTGVFTTTKKGIPCRTYYQINLNVLIALLSNLKYIKLDNQFAEKHHINMLEFNNQEYTNFSNQNDKIKQAIINNKEYSQNTTEINSDNTSDTPLPPKGGLNNKNKNDKFIIKGKTTFANNRNQGILYSPPKPEFNYNGFNEEEIFAIKEWFDYKEEINNPYRSQNRLNALRATLLELKESNDVVASIHHSLAAEYNGVFPAPSYLLKNR